MKTLFNMLAYIKNFKIVSRVFGLMLLTAGLSATAAEEYYTWVDENGVVNYAERNPQGYDARHVTPNEARFGRKIRPQFAPQPEASQTPETAGAASGESGESGEGDGAVDPDQLIAAQRISTRMA